MTNRRKGVSRVETLRALGGNGELFGLEEQREMLTSVFTRSFDEHDSQCALLIGYRGTGKSSLVALVASEFSESHDVL
jgi:predicted AAA+ superfamily ATPase